MLAKIQNKRNPYSNKLDQQICIYQLVIIVLGIEIILLQFKMSEVNQSNVAIKMKNDESFIFEADDIIPEKNQEQIDRKQVPIITENVPFTNPIKSINYWYIGFNINFNCSCLIVIVILSMSFASLLTMYLLVSYLIVSYIVYLAVAYKFSNLLFLTDLRSSHEYQSIFQKMVTADCSLKFTYLSGRNRIDQNGKRYDQEYKKVKIIDKSGRLYHIQRNYSLALIKYHKRFYYSDERIKTSIMNEFHTFVEKCRRQFEGSKRKLLNSQQRIQLVIKDFASEVGYYIQEDNQFKWLFIITLFLGLGVYFQCFMKNKVLRYEMDIVKEVCPK